MSYLDFGPVRVLSEWWALFQTSRSFSSARAMISFNDAKNSSVDVVFRLLCHFWISFYELEFLPSVAKLMIDLFSSIAQYKMPFFSRSYKMRWNRYLLTIPVLLINGKPIRTHSLIVLAHCQKKFFGFKLNNFLRHCKLKVVKSEREIKIEKC